MKRPWQIWTLFALCLAMALPAMAWLTLKGMELDQAEAAAQRRAIAARREEAAARRQAVAARQLADLARQQAELQERVSSALWRLDWTVTPLVAQEAARPYFVYQPFFPGSGGKGTKGGGAPVPSPLLIQPSEFVLLHFQCNEDDNWTSPQCPSEDLSPLAISNGAPPSNIDVSRQRLDALKQEVGRQQLLAMLPDRMLPAVEVAANNRWANNLTFNYNGDTLSEENSGIVNDLGIPQIDNLQVEQGQNGPPPQQALANQPQQGPEAPNQAPHQQAQPPSPQQKPQGGASSRNSAQPQFPAVTGASDAANQYAANFREQLMRGGQEWQGRNRAYQSYAQSQVLQQRANTFVEPSPMQLVSEGVSRPVWIGSKLVLARRVIVNNQEILQGCWLDWPKIQAVLLREARELLPEVELVPVTPDSQVQAGRLLATLPVQVVLPEPTVSASVMEFDFVDREEPVGSWSAIRVSLIVAWSCLLVATVAVAVLLQGVITLSERRGAFVSAVTHELRTPLTTFRMYAEMLSAGMVPDAERRQHYLDTLRIEADRLSHLVENVLSYARLERGKPGRRREALPLSSLLDRVESRLADRAGQAEMKLVVEADESARDCIVATDPAAVEQILFNLVDNACKYAATAEDRRIHLQLTADEKNAHLRVRDHGPGIARQESRRLFHPFSKSVHEAADTAPGVGLGLALCRRLASALGGRLELEDRNETGASFALSLPRKPRNAS